MKKAIIAPVIFFIFTLIMSCTNVGNISIDNKQSINSFPLVSQKATDIIYDKNDAAVVEIAANLFSEDIQRVTDQKPNVLTALPLQADNIIIVGTIGNSECIDTLIKSKKLDVSKVKNKWEAYTITTIKDPFDGIGQALIIAGSDRRATAYGVFTISEAIGVSPWYYWADVPTPKKTQLHFSSKTIVQDSPSIKYRGIFINDEDWGLQPWAAKHLDTDIKDLGPKTYAKVFELLLRLKANYIWPGMHPCTEAFNIYPENKIIADNYAIVMGASHCEPMLRNNVTEWNKQTMGDWNYETNRNTVYNYWDSRVRENGQFENVYTVGMRGIHDSDMPGGGSLMDKRLRLERVITDQRKMLKNHVNPDPSKVPQIFCPYKEVLNIYKQGLELPDDITFVWPDDNFGYIRNLSTPDERKRSGRSGVYYHMSYWGVPQDFLWISSTSPALISYEMNKAYAYGADRVWIFNVGDIKPCEMEMTFALELAYNINKWPAEKAMDFLHDWAARTFPPEHAKDIAEIQKEYYRLTQQAKPEHINRVTFSKQEQTQRLGDYQKIVDKTDKIYKKVDPAYKNAFFQLVLYPVKSAALMNQKHTYTVQGDAELAIKAYDGIMELANYYNKQLVSGKWDRMMDPAPRNTKVFHKPDTKAIGQLSQKSVHLISLKPTDAKYQGQMKLIDNNIIATAPDILPENSGSNATFTFNSDSAQKAVLYFLARCPDDKSDSWFVSFNGKKVTSNDQPTGIFSKWLKIMDVDLHQGSNQLVISHREPGSAIKEIALMTPGKGPEDPIIEPKNTFAANEYSTIKNTTLSKWTKIEGLGIEKFAMTLMPYETPSIDDADFAKAPSITYSFENNTSKCMVEARFLPTHRINEGMGLRYAVSVDDGPIQIRDINAPEWSGTWSQNVLKGFSLGSTTHDIKNPGKHTVTIYLLDPGMVLCQARIY